MTGVDSMHTDEFYSITPPSQPLWNKHMLVNQAFRNCPFCCVGPFAIERFKKIPGHEHKFKRLSKKDDAKALTKNIHLPQCKYLAL